MIDSTGGKMGNKGQVIAVKCTHPGSKPSGHPLNLAKSISVRSGWTWSLKDGTSTRLDTPSQASPAGSKDYRGKGAG
ncbi:hypothetical protein PsYK624_101400 [Phanerochaete sordida]|uniref:Uncharacterized protein n=1 Tax=Phanerochaete sordida TaxID=48140 RepID=A0A9P3LGM9_9APHY|nr:hypothetical protein PsYK624_101400 [Phanerochaete sordida]